MIVFSNTPTPRLAYITDFIGRQINGKPFRLTNNSETYRNFHGPKINYSDEPIVENEIYLKPHTLLFEKDIRQQETDVFEFNKKKKLFKSSGSLQFDIFAASFYLLSRYEEWLPHKKDIYGRFAHENSVAFKHDFLHLPLVNLWINDLKKLISEKFPGYLKEPGSKPATVNLKPTYDIDIAWSYRNKGYGRNIGGAVKSILKGKWGMFSERMSVLKGTRKDPYDSYDWLDKLHKRNGLEPLYFFHVGSHRGKFDKNISPSNPKMQELIRRHAERYPVGLHPSWASGDHVELLEKEIRTLEKICNRPVSISRQHYLRFNLPDTYRNLIKAGIKSDYSMGYGSINGFRASVASPFYWYDIEKEEATSLEVFPFCFMDANAFYEQNLSAQEALKDLRMYGASTRDAGGLMITIWHNNFLGTDPMFMGWKEIYESFIHETKVGIHAGRPINELD